MSRSTWALLASMMVIACASGARAQTAAPSPAPSNSPAPVPSGWRIVPAAFTTYVDTSASGPGLAPPEGPGFAAGSPLSPMTPYDTLSSAPQTPGEAGIAEIDVAAHYTGRKYDASALAGAALVTGSMQTAAYWGESLLPTLNPHLGYTALPYRISFATHAGGDDASAAIVSPLYGSFGAHDGTWSVRAGFFNVQQTLRFVFVQPPLSSVTPAIGMSTPETLGSGAPSLDVWPTPQPGLPLHGVDLWGRRGIASFELTNAALPALPGTGARATILSAIVDHGEGTQYAAQFLHAVTGGDPIQTTTLYGSGATTNPGPQGPLPTSTLGGQIETIAGARAAFHLTRVLNGVLEAGRTWYNAAGVLEPGTNAPGGLYHGGVSAHAGSSTYAVDAYRFEGRYANMILPYGVPENVWSVGWSWPGVWLKSNYQLVDNLQYPGSNRQGYRVRYGSSTRALDVSASIATFHQIEPSTLALARQTGFVDGFFLPQFNDAGTLGEQHQYAVYVAWHPRFGDVTVDYVDDLMHRGFVSTHPEDDVSYQAPQAVLTYTRRFGKTALADAGFGRYAMKGSFGQSYTNVDYFQNVYFAGAQFAETAHDAVLLQIRRSAFAGAPSMLGGPPPNYRATTLVIEQRFQ